MSEELKIKVGIDVSDAEKAAQALPAAFNKIDQQNSRDFSRTTGGVINPASLGGSATFPTQPVPTNQSQQQTAEEREIERRKKQEKKEADEILKLKMAEYAKKKKLEEQAAKSAEEWASVFSKHLTGGLITTFAPLALFATGLSAISDWFKKGADRQNQINASVSVGGFAPEEVRMARNLASSLGSTMTEDEGQQFMEEAMTKARNYAKGVSVEGALGLESFGMGRDKTEDVLSGKASYIEMLAKMADEYERTGNTAAYAAKMQSLFGDKWEKLRPQLASGRRVLTNDILGSSGTTIGDLFDDAMDINSERLLHGQGPVKNWMGGSKNGGLQSFAMPSSLQAMGGGDVLSAISRGPVDKIADATERTAEATESMATGSGNSSQSFNKGNLTLGF